MPRTYSRTGCLRCKSRKKRCSEERPVCSGCAKWGWACLYEVPKSRTKATTHTPVEASADVLDTTAVIKPEIIQVRVDHVEGKVLQTIPELIQAFFSPTAGGRLRDLQVMWQLMMSNELLRNASVACFSVVIDMQCYLDQFDRREAVFGGSGIPLKRQLPVRLVEKAEDEPSALEKTNQMAYGKALRSLRNDIKWVGVDQEITICVISSILFLAIMESLGPQSFADALEHWTALILLLGNDEVAKLCEQGVLPMNENKFIFESMLYNFGTHAIFSCMTERAWHLWTTYRLYERLCNLNPDGPGRLTRSAMLYGQYTLYNLAFRVTYLAQTHRGPCIPSHVADEMEALVRHADARLDDEFAAVVSSSAHAPKHRAECIIYHLFAHSILIWVTALREASARQKLQLEHLVAVGLKMYQNLPCYGDDPQLADHATHFMLAAIWPIEILGCAMYDRYQFRVFIQHYLTLEPFVDVGHQKRARALLGQVAARLKGLPPEEGTNAVPPHVSGRPIPVGMALLRHPVRMIGFDESLTDV